MQKFTIDCNFFKYKAKSILVLIVNFNHLFILCIFQVKNIKLTK